MLILYGLKNCDTCRKARAWLAQQKLPYQFHDFRVQGLEPELLERLEAELGWEALINRRGITWRGLAESDRIDMSRGKALGLMLAHPALIKRPILVAGNRTFIGFSAGQYAQEL